MTIDKIMGYTVDEEIRSDVYGSLYRVSKENGADMKLARRIPVPTEGAYEELQNADGGKSVKLGAFAAKAAKDIDKEIAEVKALSSEAKGQLLQYCGHKFVKDGDRYRLFVVTENATPFSEYAAKNVLTVRDAIAVTKAVAADLKVLHGEKRIHGCVCEQNVYVTEDGCFKLSGFDAMNCLQADPSERSEKSGYRDIAPEWYLGKGLDCSVDVYALGMLCYRLLNRSRSPLVPSYPLPYTETDEIGAFERRLHGAIPPLPLGAENKLGEVIRKAVTPREERYNTVEAFSAALETVEKTLTQAYSDTPLEELDENTPKDVIMELPVAAESSVEVKAETEVPQAVSMKDDEMPIGIPEKDKKWTKSRVKTLVCCVLPVLTAVLLVWFYAGLTPRWYGTSVTVAEWLTADVDALIADAATVHPEYSFVGGKDHTIALIVLQYALFAAFVLSLIALIVRGVKKKRRRVSEAVYFGREPYFNLVGVCVSFEKANLEELEPSAVMARAAAEALKSLSFGECADKKAIAAETEIGRAIDELSIQTEKCLQENTRENRDALFVAAQKLTSKIQSRERLSGK